MTEKEILKKLTEIFREVFDEEELVIDENTSASDIEAWDSMMHITLMGTIEDELGTKFSIKQMGEMKNVGQMIEMIRRNV